MGTYAESSASDNRYVIVLTDYLTKYVVAKAVPTNTAVSTAEFLLETSLTFGVPSHILTDQGSHFKNDLIRSMVSVFGCKHTLITPYHPQSNGLTERWNATMTPKLNLLHDKNLQNWDVYLPGIVHAYNTGLHASTGFSPSHLMFGRDIALAFDSSRPVVSISKPSDYLTHLSRHRQLVLQEARVNTLRYQQMVKKRYDKHRQNPVYRVGDLVLIRRFGTSTKQSARYVGPYTVSKCLSSHTYLVNNEHENRQCQVHVNDMHPISE